MNIKMTFLVFVLLSAFPVSGQEYGGQWGASPRDVKNKIGIDSCILRVSYDLSFAIDTISKIRKTDIQVLEIGKRGAHFYSLYADRIDSVMYRARLKSTGSGGVNLYGWLKKGAVGRYEDVYTDYPSKGEMEIVTRFFSVDYVCRQQKENCGWNFSGVELKTILGYHCGKATCTLHGRRWVVWYSLDIPSGYGPWKFNGLPGMILEAYDTDNLFHWVASGIETPRNVAIYTYKNYAKSPHIKRADVLKLLTQKWADPVGFHLRHGAQVTIADKDGKWHTGVAGEYSLPYMPSFELE